MKSETVNPATGNFEEDNFDLPLDREFIFSNHKNASSKRMEKRQKKLLRKIPAIKHFLQEGEKIALVSTGCSPASLLEQVIAGSIFIYLKRSLIVFTDRRIFHIPTKKDFSYRQSIAQILYADCRTIEVKGSKLVVEYKSGKKEKFLYIPSYARKKIKTMLPRISFTGHSTAKQERVHLCPRCTKELQQDRYSCQSCHLEFRNMEQARKLSIIYPGGGYFYTGHPFLGIGDAIVETIFIVLVLTALVGTIKGIRGSSVNLAIFTALLAVEKVITIYHSNHFIREYIPKEKGFKPTP